METISSCVVKKCLINIFKDLAPASDQFFRHLSQFFYFLCFARVTGKRYKYKEKLVAYQVFFDHSTCRADGKG